MGLSAEKDRKLSDLMKSAQDGDGEAYHALLNECAVLIRPFIRGRLSEGDAEDVVQETLISVHRARHTYDPEKAFAPWLYAIAAHRVADFQRRSIRISRREVLDEQAMLSFSEDDGSYVRSRLDDEVGMAILELPEKQKRVIDLLKMQELPVKDVASKLGMSESAVKVTAFRAYEALRKRFGVKKRAD